jgi:hypothetical protein
MLFALQLIVVYILSGSHGSQAAGPKVAFSRQDIPVSAQGYEYLINCLYCLDKVLTAIVDGRLWLLSILCVI